MNIVSSFTLNILTMLENDKHLTPQQFQQSLFSRGTFVKYNYSIQFQGIVDSAGNDIVSDTRVQGGEVSLLTFQAVRVQLPTIGVESLSVIRLNESQNKVPLKQIRGDFRVTFRQGKDLAEWKQFRKWQSSVAKTNNLSYFDSYTTQIIVRTLLPATSTDSQPQMISEHTLDQCFPLAVDAPELKQDATQEDYFTFEVEFSYTRITDTFSEELSPPSNI